MGRRIFYWKTEIGGWAGMRQGFERQGGIVDQLMLSAFQKMKRCWRLFFADGRTCFLDRWLRRLGLKRMMKTAAGQYQSINCEGRL